MCYQGQYVGNHTFDTELLLVPGDYALTGYDEIADNFRRTFETNWIEVMRINERLQAAAHAHEEKMREKERLHKEKMWLHEEKMLLIKIISEATSPEDKEFFKKQLESVNTSLQAA